MSKKRWFFLWLLFIGYLFLGAAIFYNIERDLEEERRQEKYSKGLKIQAIIKEHLLIQNNLSLSPYERERNVNSLYDKLSIRCALPQLRGGENATEAEPYTWTFYNSFFFSLTTLSTIGYGNLSPTSDQGKIAVIIYSLIGIPFNGIVLTHLGEFFGTKFLRAHHRYKNHVYVSRVALVMDILVYLIPGMGVFILAPSVIFKYCEKWTFIESIYYSFVTLTTIGYGDYVAGQVPERNIYDVIYKIFLIFWIMFGLGYLVMILGYISRAMKSKHINKLERKVAQTLKHTQSKIWNEFVSDVHFLRRIMNEMYLMKVKPVYKHKPYFKERLSRSCPNLRDWLEEGEAIPESFRKDSHGRRRRAFSENGQDWQRLHRVLSDGALHGIDLQATFSSPLLDPTAGLFIPSAFGPGSPEESDSEDYKEGGVNMFSDEEILASEEYRSSRGSMDSWFLGGQPLRRPGRAMSDAQVIIPPHPQQKTWAGDESLHQFALLKAMRAKSNEWPTDEEKGLKGMDAPAKGLQRLSHAAMNFFSPTNKLKKKKSATDIHKNHEDKLPTIFSKISHKHRLSLQVEDKNAMNSELNYLTHMPNNRRPSLLDLFANGQNRDASISPLLEQTSIADFIRAVQSMKAMEASRPTSPTLLQEAMRSRGMSYSSGGPLHFPKRRLSHRRHSQIPSGMTGIQKAEPRPRAASIAPVLPGPVDRRVRKISGTTKNSPLSSGRATPTPRPFPLPTPSLVVTSPDGTHKFSIHTVEPTATEPVRPKVRPPLKRAGSLKDLYSKSSEKNN